jgi:hypothetical protein
VQIKSLKFEIRIQNQKLKLEVLSSVYCGPIALVNKFWKIIRVELNLSPKREFIPRDFYTSMKIYKNYGGQKVCVLMVQTELYKSVFRLKKFSSSFCLTISTVVNSISSSILGYGVCVCVTQLIVQSLEITMDQYLSKIELWCIWNKDFK